MDTICCFCECLSIVIRSEGLHILDEAFRNDLFAVKDRLSFTLPRFYIMSFVYWFVVIGEGLCASFLLNFRHCRFGDFIASPFISMQALQLRWYHCMVGQT
ncbi:hypothetical protein Droror1_Dr00018767 [Drosera rotundifolia]